MIVLASASPRRKELLSLMGIEFLVNASDVDETIPKDIKSPKQAVEYLSKIKAMATFDGKQMVIGADTVVALDGKILGKPADKREAMEMLFMLSGKTHSVFTGVTVATKEKTETFSVETLVQFFNLSQGEIEKYVETGEPMDKAGAYGIQGKGALFVKEIHGDYFNVVGLPISRLAKVIKKLDEKNN